MNISDFFEEEIEKTQEIELDFNILNYELDDDIELLEEIEHTREMDLSKIFEGEYINE